MQDYDFKIYFHLSPTFLPLWYDSHSSKSVRIQCGTSDGSLPYSNYLLFDLNSKLYQESLLSPLPTEVNLLKRTNVKTLNP